MRLQLLGSVLFSSCRKDTFWPAPAVGIWQNKVISQLERATADLYRWRKRTRFGCSFKRFKLSQLHVQRRDLDFPWLKSKAVNAAVLTEFLLFKYRSISTPDAEDVMIKLCLTGFAHTYRIIKHKRRWLTDSECATLEQARLACLGGYNALSSQCASTLPQRALYGMIPKFHQLDHLLRDAIETKMNPRVFWTLGDESFGGEVALCCRSLHPTAMCRRAVDRWLAVFFQTAREF